MVRTAAEAIAWGRAQQKRPTQDWHGMCLSFVRQSFGLDYVPASAWPNDKRFAGEAWRRSNAKHPTTNTASIPAGVPIFWNSKSEYEHIALSLGGGRCLSTDVPRSKVGEVGIDELTRAWGMEFLGWSEKLIGNRVFGEAPSPAAPKPSAGGGVQPLRIDGVDISHFQSGALDYAAGMRAGVDWLYHKGTEGATYADPLYGRRRSEAQKAGLPFGAYHFARPAKGDADTEAVHFLSTAKPLRGDLIPMLDLEDAGGLSRAELTLWVRTFVRNIERSVGVKPIIYTPFDLDDSHGCMLWVARYNDRNEPPRVPKPWQRWDVRQFSNGQFGVPDQVAGFGRVDLNTMRDGLTVTDLTIPVPVTEPEPVVEPPAPEPPAPPVPAKPPHDPFTVGLLPGRWDAPLKAWLDRHREVRDQAAQIVTLTEGTRPALVEDFTRALNQIAGEGPLFWEVYHDPTPGPANIIHTWDGNRFEQVGIPWKVQLDTIQIWSKKGFARPNTYAVGIALRDKQADKVILLVGAHLPLENTVRRRKAKEEALAVLKDKAFDSGREQFPDSVRMFACDWNRRAHKQTVRDWFKATWPGLAASWATRAVRTQGPDWVAAGNRLVNLESVVLPRVKGDPLDHTTKVTRWGWR
jgi:GH25 family lysozyme M1 (1,4-beta-N-acetylmuramidase)